MMKLMNGSEVVAEVSEITYDVKEKGWRCGGVLYSDPDKIFSLDAGAKLSPVQFKMCFTSQERIAIKALRATNPILEDAYEILDDPRLTTVDMALASNQQMIDYLVTLGVLTAERAAEIKAGKML